MENLKDETLLIMQEHGKDPEDIVWIGCPKFAIGPASFWRLADRIYDDGYGGEEVARDLMIVGSDWWLERHSYDGAEWWEYKTIPVMPKETRNIDRVIRDSDHWVRTLEGMNTEEPDIWDLEDW